jgi:hypothetical protein
MTYRATTPQRAQIYNLLREAELDVQTLSLMHKPAIEAAGMSFCGWNGERVDVFLSDLTAGQAAAYIAALVRQIGDP